MHTAAAGSVPTGGPRPVPSTGSDARRPDSVGALYDRYGVLAFTLAYRIVQDRGTAEDVVQEAFLAVWRNADRFDPIHTSVRTLLCQIVRSRALDRMRGNSRRQMDPLSLDELTSLARPADVVADVPQCEESRSVVAALAALPPGQRDAIELAYYGGLSPAEIASMRALPVGTVKGRTRAAMRALACSLGLQRSTQLSTADVLGPADREGHAAERRATLALG